MSNVRLFSIALLATTAVACKIDPLPPRTNHDAATDMGGAGGNRTGANADAPNIGTGPQTSAGTSGAGMTGAGATAGMAGTTRSGGAKGSGGTGAFAASTGGAGGITGTSGGPNFVEGTCANPTNGMCLSSSYKYNGPLVGITLFFYVTNVGTDGVVQIGSTAGSYTETTKSFTVKAGASYIVEAYVPLATSSYGSFTYSSTLPGTPGLVLTTDFKDYAVTGPPSTTLVDQASATEGGGSGGGTGTGGAGTTGGAGGTGTGAGGVGGTANASGGGIAEGGTTATGSSVPVLKVSPSSVNFGSVDIGDSSADSVVTVISTAAVVVSPTVTGAGFRIDSTTCGTASLSCTISVKFSPASVGGVSGILNIATGLTVSLSGMGGPTGTGGTTGTGGAASTAGVTETGGATGAGGMAGTGGTTGTAGAGGAGGTGGATGSGTNPLTISPSPATFSNVATGTASNTLMLTVRNNGTVAINGMGFTVTGANAAQFSVVVDNLTGTNIGAGLSATIGVKFIPTAVGAAAATVTVTGTRADNSAVETGMDTLIGNGQ